MQRDTSSSAPKYLLPHLSWSYSTLFSHRCEQRVRVEMVQRAPVRARPHERTCAARSWSAVARRTVGSGGRNCEDAHRGGRASLGFVRKLMVSSDTVVICNEAVRKAAASKRLAWARRAVVFPGTLTQRGAGDTRTQWLRRARELAALSGTLLPRIAAVASGRSLNHLN